MNLRARAAALLGPDFEATAIVAAEPGRDPADLVLTTRDGTAIPATFLHPPGPGPHPAILYCHAHGNRYQIGRRELTEGRPALGAPYAPDLAALGLAVLCLEMPTFGARRVPGEASLSKARLWQGRTLFGQMLGELRAGLDWLARRPEIDAARIATLGISMGGTQAWWLAALEPRVAACVQIACLADMASLIETGAHDIHGAYMTVPGLLPLARTGQIAGLCAPRPQLVCAGLRDPGTPEPALRIALRDMAAAYGDGPGLQTLVEAETGHAESPAMRAAVLAFLARHVTRASS